MNNFNLPASPQPIAFHPNNDTPLTTASYELKDSGFTKIELASLMIAQGMLSNSPDWSEKDTSINWIAVNSVKYAKAVLEEANK